MTSGPPGKSLGVNWFLADLRFLIDALDSIVTGSKGNIAMVVIACSGIWKRNTSELPRASSAPPAILHLSSRNIVLQTMYMHLIAYNALLINLITL